MMGGYWGWGLNRWNGLVWILILILVVWIVSRLFNSKRQDETRASPDTSLEILKERYARGEISKEQYDQMKKEIGP